jgi:hypothetical protein
MIDAAPTPAPSTGESGSATTVSTGSPGGAIDGAVSFTDAYGFNPQSSCASGTCMYGIARTTGGDCRALGGAMNGSPADGEWTDCHMNFGRGAPRGLLAPGSCPSGKCQYGAITMAGASCRALGGAMNGKPGDDEQTLCHFNIGASPRMGFYPRTGCPTGRTCYPTHVRALTTQCRALGGDPDPNATDGEWTDCHLNVGPTV